MAHTVFARALTAHLARRLVRIATIVVTIVLITLLLITWALAHFFTPWWWLLLLPLGVAAAVLLVIRLILLVIIRQIYRQQLSSEQSDQIESFVDKIQGLPEARSTPFPLIVLLCIKDLLLHRDLVTVRKTIKVSTSLAADYRKLEKLFG